MFGLPGGFGFYKGVASNLFLNSLSTFFTGTTQYVELGTPADLTVNLATSEFTIAAWVKPKDLSTNNYVVAKARPFAPEIAYILGIGTSGQLFGYFGGTSNNTEGTAGAITTSGSWYLVGMTVTASGGVVSGSLWVNAVHSSLNFDARTSSATFSTIPVRIGAGGNTTTPDLPFQGYIDEVSFWNRGFSQTDWTQLYNSGVPFDIRNHAKAVTLNLKHFYRMGDGDTFPRVLDLTGSVSGTLVNMSASNFTGTVP